MTDVVNRVGLQLQNPQIYRRIAALGAMLGLLWVFRKLALLFVTLFLCVHAFHWITKKLVPLFRGHYRPALIAVLLLIFGALGGGVWLFVHFGLHRISKEIVPAQGMLQYVKEIRAELIAKLPAWIPVNSLLEKALESATDFAKNHATIYAQIVGKGVIYIIVGCLVAIVYLLDQKKVDELLGRLHPKKFWGILREYFSYIGEALLITVKLQVLVALVNTILTLPVLLLLRLPHLGLLSGIIFLSSMIPILGNFISGAVLVTYSYIHKGIGGVAIFLAITMVLHKVEAYYLNPRLSSKHVQLPTIALVISLILFESLFGIVGIFLSFPCLYVGIKIAQGFKKVQTEATIVENVPPQSS